ncbi:uncharacterized protein M6D78_016786 isoform 1-T1 [Vipera latastei]
MMSQRCAAALNCDWRTAELSRASISTNRPVFSLSDVRKGLPIHSSVTLVGLGKTSSLEKRLDKTLVRNGLFDFARTRMDLNTNNGTKGAHSSHRGGKKREKQYEFLPPGKADHMELREACEFTPPD